MKRKKIWDILRSISHLSQGIVKSSRNAGGRGWWGGPGRHHNHAIQDNITRLYWLFGWCFGSDLSGSSLAFCTGHEIQSSRLIRFLIRGICVLLTGYASYGDGMLSVRKIRAYTNKVLFSTFMVYAYLVLAKRVDLLWLIFLVVIIAVHWINTEMLQTSTVSVTLNHIFIIKFLLVVFYWKLKGLRIDIVTMIVIS